MWLICLILRPDKSQKKLKLIFPDLKIQEEFYLRNIKPALSEKKAIQLLPQEKKEKTHLMYRGLAVFSSPSAVIS